MEVKHQNSIYKQYLFLFCITPTIILIIGIFFGLVSYKFLQDNQKVLYQGEAEKISSIIEEDLNYLANYSKIVGESIYNEDNPTASSIGKLLQETYSIAEIGQDVTTLTRFDFVLPSGMVIADVTEGKLKIP